MENEQAQYKDNEANQEDSDDDANASQTPEGSQTGETTNEVDKPNQGKVLLDITCISMDNR